MPDPIETDPQATVAAAFTPATEEPTATAAETPTEPEQTGGNPAWDSLRTKLDPAAFQAIEPELRAWETDAQRRIESNNQKYGWAAELMKQGNNPDDIKNALIVAQKLNSSPEEVHEALGTFLKENGRLPNKQELSQEIQANNDDPNEEDPRFTALAQQTEEIKEFLAAREQERIQTDADKALDQEVTALKTAHPEFTDADVHEVMLRAAAAAQFALSQGKRTVPPLEVAAADYKTNVLDRIRTAPRAADTAPKLLPTNGGVPGTAISQKAVGDLSRKDTQDIIAEYLTRAKG